MKTRFIFALIFLSFFNFNYSQGKLIGKALIELGEVLGVMKSTKLTPIVIENVLINLSRTQLTTYEKYKNLNYSSFERNGKLYMIYNKFEYQKPTIESFMNRFDKEISKNLAKRNTSFTSYVSSKDSKIYFKELEVKSMQLFLKRFGFDIKIDGKFGIETRNALTTLLGFDCSKLSYEQIRFKLNEKAKKFSKLNLNSNDNKPTCNSILNGISKESVQKIDRDGNRKNLSYDEFINELQEAKEKGCEISSVCLNDNDFEFELECENLQGSVSFSASLNSIGIKFNSKVGGSVGIEFEEGEINLNSKIKLFKL